MKKIIYLLLIFSMLFLPLVGEDFEKTKLAIMPFKDGTGKFDKKLNNKLFSYLEDYFTKTKRFRILERRNIEKIISEKELIFSGATDIENIEEIAPLLAVEKFVVGDITSFSKFIGDPYLDVKNITKKKGKRYNKKRQKEEYIVENYTKYTLKQDYGVDIAISCKVIDTSTGEVLDTITARFKRTRTETEGLGTYKNGIVTGIAINQRVGNHKGIINKTQLASLVDKGIKSCAKKAVKEIAKKVKLTATLYAIHNGKYLISLGKKNGLFDKANLEIYNVIKTKNHSSGKVYSYKERVAVLFVTKIHDDHSEAVYVSGDKSAIKPLADVQVIDPVFVLPSMLASAAVPGLGNILHGTGGWGYFFSELFFFGIGLPTALGVWDGFFVPSNRGYLDNVIITSDGNNRGRNGTTTSSSGRVQDDIKNGVHLAGWILTGIGAIIHVVNIVDGATPARRNSIFVNEGTALWYNKKHNQYNAQDRIRLDFKLVDSPKSYDVESTSTSSSLSSSLWATSVQEKDFLMGYYFGLSYLF